MATTEQIRSIPDLLSGHYVKLRLSESDKSEMLEYLDNLMLLMGALGNGAKVLVVV